jgi:toluene monooxygenase electron transfer component
MTSFRIQLSDGASFECDSTDTVTRAGLRAGFAMPYECNVGGCGTCRCGIEGEVEDLFPQAPVLSERDRKKGRRLGCQSRPRSGLTLSVTAHRLPDSMPRPRRMHARLVGTSEVTPDIREFCFQLAEPMNFLAGQYALLEIPGVGSVRAYSMSNTAADGGTKWHFQIRKVPGGRATEILFDRPELGAAITIDGPYGNAYLREDAARDIVCIAGGSGLAPMLSVARGAATSPALEGRRIRFFMGGRTPADIGGEKELAALPGFGDSLIFHPVISCPDESVEWSGATGYVHEVAADLLAQTPLENFEWYFAGPPPLVGAIEDMLRAADVPAEQVHFDRYF